MINFFIYLIGLVASVFVLAFSLRYGLKAAGSWDDYINSRYINVSQGFQWYYRIPLAIGVIPEFYFFMVLGSNNYFKRNWWALRTTAFISFLLFIVLLTSRSTVESYYSLKLVAENGISVLLTSGLIFWYLNILNLLYIGVFALITIESIRMQHWYAPVRIILYTVLSLLLSTLTLIVLSLIIAFTLIYMAYKIIKFLFFSRKHRRYNNKDDINDEESTSKTLKTTFRDFRSELYEWEQTRKTVTNQEKKKKKPTIKRKRPKIVRKSKVVSNENIQRFHPD